MIYYCKIEGQSIQHAVTYPIDGYVKVDTRDTPLIATLNDNYKWVNNSWVYIVTYENSGFDSFIKGFIDSGKLTESEVWDIASKVYNDFNLVKSILIKKVSAECKKSILSGFYSSAYQGIEKHYDNELEDQSRISSLVNLASMKLANPAITDIIKWKATGEVCVEYQPMEMIQLGFDMRKWIESNTDKYAEIKKKILDSETFEKAVENSKW